MTLKIWGRTNSQNVKKVLWIAYELELPFESVVVGGQYGGTKTDEYRALNPNSQIPTIQDGEFVLYESNAIVRYLAAQYSTSLWPSDARVRAGGDKWMDWVATSWGPAIKPVFWGLIRTPAEERNWDTINAGIHALNALVAIPEAALATQAWFSGEEFGIGDIPLGCFLYTWFELPIKRVSTPNLDAWYQRLKARPAYQKAVMIPLS